MNKLISEQLTRVEKADLTHFDETTHVYFIPQRKDIRLEIDKYYLIHLKDSFFNNDAIKINWNNNKLPDYKDFKVDICKILANMVNVSGSAYDPVTEVDISYYWKGWVPIQDMDIIKKL